MVKKTKKLVVSETKKTSAKTSKRNVKEKLTKEEKY
jgi:hypothetical protein